MTPPIPRRLLTSTALVRVPDASAAYGGEYEAPREVSRVCVQGSDALRPTDYQLRDAASGVLFIDARNSGGAFAVPAGSLVSVDGGPESCVAECREYAEGGRVHHWELVLR